MSYNLLITKTARNDLIDAANYIEYSLKNPIAADNFLDAIEEHIDKLTVFPDKHPVVDDPVLASWGIRFIVVNNYMVFYIVDNSTVRVIRILYGKRNWVSILKYGIGS